MSMRKLMAGAAGGLVMAFGAGHISTLQAQGTSVYQSADQQFINHLAAGNLLEVRLAQATGQRAANPSVKQFAQRMVVDHTNMQKQWMALASRNRLEFRAELSPEQVAQAEQLQKVSGADFDRNYMTLMVQNHRNNLYTFQNERRVAHSPEVLGLIDQDLVTIQNHLTLAQQVGSQVGADVSGGVAAIPPRTDTVSVNPTIPPRKDTTHVGTQIPMPAPTHKDHPRDDDRAIEADIKADAAYIRNIDNGHQLEIRLGRLAQEKGRDPAVKRYGERIEEHHADLQRQWRNMASRNGMNLKDGMGPLHRVKLERLEKVSGRAFDRAFMTQEIQNHQDYLNYYRKEGRAAHSAPVRQVVNRSIPTLEEHMDMAKRVGRQVGVDPQDALAGRRISAKR